MTHKSCEREKKKRTGTSRRAPRLYIRTLVTLPNPYFPNLKRCAFQAVAEAQNRCKSELSWEFTAKERADAESFLDDLARAAQSEGKYRGDSPTLAENRRMLDVLKQLASGKTLKDCVPEGSSSEFENRHRSLSTRLNRFCRRVYREVIRVHRPEELSKNSNGNLNVTQFTLGFFRYALKGKNWTNISFEKTTLAALREAVRRGESLDRLRES